MACVYNKKKFTEKHIDLIYVNIEQDLPGAHERAFKLKEYFNVQLKPAIVSIGKFKILNLLRIDYEIYKNNCIDLFGLDFNGEAKNIIDKIREELKAHGQDLTCHETDVEKQKPALIIVGDVRVRSNFALYETAVPGRAVKIKGYKRATFPLNIGESIVFGPHEGNEGTERCKIIGVWDKMENEDGFFVYVSVTGMEKEHPVNPDNPRESHVCYQENILALKSRSCGICPLTSDNVVKLHEFLHLNKIAGLPDLKNAPENIMCSETINGVDKKIHQFYGQWDALHQNEYGKEE
jgi:hypothetical protein